jgi:hypothetical protein
MSKQSTTAAVPTAGGAAYGRRDMTSEAPEMTPTRHELEAENLGLRNTVVDLALRIAALREALPAGSGDMPGRIGGATMAGQVRRRS